MIYFDFIPPHLANLGVKRQTPSAVADLKTIWATPYPVVTNYKALCKEAGMKVFGGASLEHPNRFIVPGAVTSGYRDKVVGTRSMSPHLHGMAIDVAVGGPEEQARVARIATKYFNRVGFYPLSGFLHLDLMPDAWVQKYNGTRSWVRVHGKYHGFDSMLGAIEFMQEAT